MLIDGYDQHLRELGLRRLLPKEKGEGGGGQQHYHHTAYAMKSSVFGVDEGDADDNNNVAT